MMTNLFLLALGLLIVIGIIAARRAEQEREAQEAAEKEREAIEREARLEAIMARRRRGQGTPEDVDALLHWLEDKPDYKDRRAGGAAIAAKERAKERKGASDSND